MKKTVSLTLAIFILFTNCQNEQNLDNVSYPQKIVSLSLTIDEILLDAVEPSRILALSSLVDDPGLSNSLDKAKSISKRSSTDVEELVALNGDLYIMPDWTPPETITLLNSMGFPAKLISTPLNLDQIEQLLIELQNTLGESPNFSQLIEAFRTRRIRLAELVDQIPIQQWPTLMEWTPDGRTGGVNSTLGHLVQRSAGRLLPEDRPGDNWGWITIDREDLIFHDPDFLMIPTWFWNDPQKASLWEEEILSDGALQDLQSLEKPENSLIKIPEKLKISTNHNLIRAMELLFISIHGGVAPDDWFEGGGEPLVSVTKKILGIALLLAVILGALLTGPLGIFHSTAWLQIRLPRIITALLAGAVLAGGGTITQSVFRNPLADTGLLGIAGGGSLGALLGMVLFGSSLPPGITALFASVGSIITALLIFSLANTRGRWNRLSLILAGLVVSTILTALISLLLLSMRSEFVSRFLFWTLGGISLTRWESLLPVLILVIPAFSLLYYWKKDLNYLLMSDREVKSVGFDPETSRKAQLLLVSVTVGLSTSLTGPLGFVGLMIPHTLRLFGIVLPSRLLGPSMLLGAAFLGSLDTISRGFNSSFPLGIWVSFIGGIFFLFIFLGNKRLLKRTRKRPQQISIRDFKSSKINKQSTRALVEIRNIDIKLGNKKLFESLEFHLNKGFFLTICGTNGSGKTTLMEMLCGLTLPDKGEVLWKGLDCQLYSLEKAAEFRSYYPVQDTPELPLTALERVLAGSRIQGDLLAKLAKKHARFLPLVRWGKEYLSNLGIAKDQLYQEMSQGEKNLVRFGALLVQDSSLLILDEPFVHLDRANKEFMKGILEAEKNRGKSIVISTQYPEEIPKATDKILYLEPNGPNWQNPQEAENFSAPSIPDFPKLPF